MTALHGSLRPTRLSRSALVASTVGVLVLGLAGCGSDSGAQAVDVAAVTAAAPSDASRSCSAYVRQARRGDVVVSHRGVPKRAGATVPCAAALSVGSR
jgi:hypothetical protein